MWSYEKKLQYPVCIQNPNPQMAQIIMSQLGGANPKKL
jgi:spore coat protein JC